LCLALFILSSNMEAVTITQWDFNSQPPDANSGTGTLTPIINVTGSAAASLVGGTTSTFASGDASGGSTDSATGDDSGWNVTTWPAASDPSETHGVQFLASTAGYQDIAVSWDQRHSNSVSRFFAFYYTTDGSTWTKLNVDAMNASPGTTPAGGNPANTAGLFGGGGTFSAFDGTVTGAGDDWFNGRSVNLNSLSGVNNNPSFGFRVLASHGGGTTYVSSSANAYASTGTSRFDMVTISGTLIPEPMGLGLSVFGVILLLAARRITM
jgi:hypothetical protein